MMKRPDLRVTAFASDVVSLMIWRSCSTVWIRLAICQRYVSHCSSGTSFHSGIRLNASQLTASLTSSLLLSPPSRSDPAHREPGSAEELSRGDLELPSHPSCLVCRPVPHGSGARVRPGDGAVAAHG